MAEDETAASSAAEETATQKPDSSAETKNTDERLEKIVSTRLEKISAQRREAEERASKLEARLKELEEKSSAPKIDEDDEPDEQVKQAKKLIEKYSAPVAQREAKALKTALEKLEEKYGELEQFRAQMRWEKLASKSGLDPEDKTHQGIVRGLIETAGMSVEDAVKKAGELVKTASRKDVASAETDGITGIDTSATWIPKDEQDAIAGALKGKRAKHISSTEAITRRLARERSN